MAASASARARRTPGSGSRTTRPRRPNSKASCASCSCRRGRRAMPTPPTTEDAAEPRQRRGSALGRAIALLSRREHSRRELERKLIQRGFGADEVAAALDRLQSAGLQDDARFAEALGRSRAEAGRGPLRLRAELAQHGLDDDLAGRVVEQAAGDEGWQDKALALVRKRFGETVADPKVARRAAD